MTSITWPDHLLTLDEWDELPEDLSRRAELVEGVLQVGPRPSSPHQLAITFLASQLNAALVAYQLVAVPEIDVVLVDAFPPLLRAPDISVVSLDAARAGPKRYRAEQLELAVEIVSPGSVRTDRIMKFADYADAGIAYYWIVDIDRPVSLDAFELVDGVYRPVHAPGNRDGDAGRAGAAHA